MNFNLNTDSTKCVRRCMRVCVCVEVCVSAAGQSKLFYAICFDFDLSFVCVCVFPLALGVLTVVHQKTDQNHETLI